MRATDIIRDLLDLIDGIDHAAVEPEAVLEPTAEIELVVPMQTEPSDANHFTQIADLITQANFADYANEPNEQYADVDAVTTHAGGGINGPKHPSDIRVDHTSMYPAHQYGVR